MQACGLACGVASMFCGEQTAPTLTRSDLTDLLIRDIITLIQFFKTRQYTLRHFLAPMLSYSIPLPHFYTIDLVTIVISPGYFIL